MPPAFRIRAHSRGAQRRRVRRRKRAPAASACCGRTAANRRQASMFATGLRGPVRHRLLSARPDPQWVYVGNTDSVVRFPYRNGDLNARGTGRDRRAASADCRRPPHARRGVLAGRHARCTSRSAPPPTSATAWRKLSATALQAWQSNHPLGAAWGNETDRADVLAFDPDGKNRRIFATGIRNCVGMAVAASERHALVLDQRARRARRQRAARLHHARARGRVLRLALVLYRRATRIRVTAASGRT